MSPKFVLNAVVSYKDVDREETLLLSSIFGFLQEAAIQQANLFDTGTRAAAASGSSWVLNRMSVKIDRYPKYEDHLRVETWSARVAGFRGYREYRIFSGEERIISGSSLWLYFNLSSKALVRVPAQVAENFPSVEDEVYAPNLDTFPITFPAETAPKQSISIRYSDVDGNGHVNNTAYFDFLQTALNCRSLSPKPERLQIKFLKEIPPDTAAVDVQLEPRGPATVFSISAEAAIFAQGQLD